MNKLRRNWMFNKKTLLIFFIAVVFILFSSATIFAQDASFSATAEFKIGVEFGYISGSLNPDAQTFNWGFVSNFEPKAHIYLDAVLFRGNECFDCLIKTGFDFYINDNLVADAYAAFLGLMGPGNDLIINYSNLGNDYELDYEDGDPTVQSPEYVAARAYFNLGFGRLLVGVKDEMSKGITETPAGDEIRVDADEYTRFELGLLDIDIVNILALNFNVEMKWKNTTGSSLGDLDDLFGDAFDGGRFELSVKAGLGFNFGIMNINLSDKFKLNETSLITNELHVDFDLIAVPNLTVKVMFDFNFDMAGGIIIEGDGETYIIPEEEFRVKKMPVLVEIAYAIHTNPNPDMVGIIIKPNVSAYFDPTYTITPYTGVAESLAYYVKVGVDFGFGGNGLFNVPVYVKLTNIPFNLEQDYIDHIDDNTYPPEPDEFFRIKIGLGVELDF
jgi:hypothetical protein